MSADGATVPSCASDPRRLCVSLFRGVSSLPVLIAQSRGYFAALGLAVEVVPTSTSHDLMSGLLTGKFQIVHAAPDNFIEWRDRTAAPILAWLGGGGGPVSLVARRGLTSVAQLRGHQIAVDAVASGFVSVLREILRGAGLQHGNVELVPVGSTNRRFQALMNGETDATMLTLPWLVLAREAGLSQLADQEHVLPGMPGSCGASLEPWLAANPELADAYLRAICAASTWMRLSENTQEMTDFVGEIFSIEQRPAAAVLAAVLDPDSGCPLTPMVDVAGLGRLCELRRRNGQPPMSAPADYTSLAPYRRVLGFGLLDEVPSHQHG